MKRELSIILKLFLDISDFEHQYSHQLYSYQKQVYHDTVDELQK